jgi:hypothetical protein
VFCFWQMVIWYILPTIKSTQADHTDNALVLIVLLQYIPRLYLIFPLSSQIIKATGVVTQTAWAGAAYNLLLYMLASHVCNFSSLKFHNLASYFFLNYFCNCLTSVIAGLRGIMVFVVHRTIRNMLEIGMQK